MTEWKDGDLRGKGAVEEDSGLKSDCVQSSVMSGHVEVKERSGTETFRESRTRTGRWEGTWRTVPRGYVQVGLRPKGPVRR